MRLNLVRLLPFLAVLAMAGPGQAHDVDLTKLPVGDDGYSGSSRLGKVFSCQRVFNKNAPGAQATGAWKRADGTYDLTIKPFVPGDVKHVSELSIERQDDGRRITGNGLPDHPTGIYPVPNSSEAARYDRNPGRIQAQKIDLRLPVEPQAAAEPGCLPMGAIGIMLSGSVLFHALDARGDDAQANEILDACAGHPQQQGVYHYHGHSPCWQDGHDAAGHSILVGYAADGFGIFGWDDVGGKLLHTADLDECHGHVGPVEWDGRVVELYHYHITPDFPYSVSCYKGTPVQFGLGGPSGPPSAGGGPGYGPRPGDMGRGPPPGGGRMPPPPRP